MTALNIHTGYSILKATCKIEELVLRAEKLGFTALAITDYGNIYGAIQFYKTCIEHNIKPLIGAEFLTDSASIILICKNEIGYKNLIKIITEGKITRNILKSYSEGLVCVAKNLLNSYGQVDFCIKIFKDDFYEVNEHLPIENICYVNSEDKQAYEILIKIGSEIVDKGTFLKPFENKIADDIANKCEFNFKFGEYKLPKFDVSNSNLYLREICSKALEQKYASKEEALERLKFELNVIENTGFSDYFLIVYDIVRFAKEKGIKVGPGRGSAAGSFVSYLLDITTIDPIENGLFFERFLNPERITMPDIDIDFCIERRDEIIKYCSEKYGKNRVASIVTFGTLSARAVIRDVGRVLNIPYNKVNYVAKMIPRELGITIEKALNQNPLFKRLYLEKSEVKQLIDAAKSIEGLPRNISTHAAGIIIGDTDLTNYIPLNLSENIAQTGFAMEELESLGLLKIDILGLKNLTIIKKMEEKLGFIYFDYKDPSTFNLISSGETLGVFQLESDGMQRFMKELKPRNLSDITAGLSLFRPGPSDFIPKYLKSRQTGKIFYTHKLLIPILKETFGCIVYQEQVMQIFVTLANYSLAEADNLRRAISKKQEDVIRNEKDRFIKRCFENGISEKDSNKVFAEMLDFAKYAFNKSHAAAYAVISFQTAYLKTHYKHEFLTTLMTFNPFKIEEYKEECIKNSIKLLRPCVNNSKLEFTRSGGDIIFGLSAIKNLGIKNAIDIALNAPFTSFADFLSRTSLNKKALDSLIFSGALDLFGLSRKYMVNYSEQISLFSSNEAEEYDEKTKKEYEKEILGVNL